MGKIKIKNLVLKFSLLHEININTLKYLVDQYGIIIVDKIVKFIYKYQYFKKCFYIKKDNYSTRFFKDDKLTSFKIVLAK
jgi:hypothetical protein